MNTQNQTLQRFLFLFFLTKNPLNFLKAKDITTKQHIVCELIIVAKKGKQEKKHNVSNKKKNNRNKKVTLYRKHMSSTIAVLETEQHGRRNRCVGWDPNEKRLQLWSLEKNPRTRWRRMRFSQCWVSCFFLFWNYTSNNNIYAKNIYLFINFQFRFLFIFFYIFILFNATLFC